MKKIMFALALLLGVVFSLSATTSTPAQAQEDLDTILARATAQSFLKTLTRPNLSQAIGFYLADSVSDTDITSLGTVSSYTLTESAWAGDTFEVETVLQPGAQTVVIRVGRPNTRWQVVNIEAGTAATDSVSGGPAAATAASSTHNTADKLVFQTKNGGDIYVINADGTGLMKVTQGIDPQLSPDGTKIVFTRWYPEYALYTINIDGTGETALVSNFAQMKSPAWSADGSKLIFSYLTYFDAGGLKNYNAGTITKRAIKAALLGKDYTIPTIPNDARSITYKDNGSIDYTIPPDAYWGLGQVEVTTNQYQSVPTGSNYNYAPVWTPNDENILLFRGDKGIASFNTASQTGQPLSTDGWDKGPLAISPDGSQIALTYWQNGHWEIHTMNSDGTNRQRLTETPLYVIAQKSRGSALTTEEGYMTVAEAQPDTQQNPNWNNAAPVWSPAGTEIAFMTDRTSQWEIWLMNADGSNQHPMFFAGELAGLEFEFAGTDDRMLSWRGSNE